jgi:hypothetical protein
VTLALDGAGRWRPGMADDAVWIEHAAGGFTYIDVDDETVAALAIRASIPSGQKAAAPRNRRR